MKRKVYVNSTDEIQIMKQVGILAREVIDYAHSLIIPGITTDEIDKKTHDFIIKNNAYPSPLNYNKFPKSIWTSINEVLCHGIPDSRKLENGDIINVDITVFKDGFHSDVNETYLVGLCDEESKYLVFHTFQIMNLAI